MILLFGNLLRFSENGIMKVFSVSNESSGEADNEEARSKPHNYGIQLPRVDQSNSLQTICSSRSHYHTRHLFSRLGTPSSPEAAELWTRNIDSQELRRDSVTDEGVGKTVSLCTLVMAFTIHIT